MTQQSNTETVTVPADQTEKQLTESELIKALLEQWLQAKDGYVQVENYRTFIKSCTDNSARYHILSTQYGDLNIHQVVEGEKYQQQVTFGAERIIPLIAGLLLFRQSELEALEARKKQAQEDQTQEDDGLGEIEDHPF